MVGKQESKNAILLPLLRLFGVRVTHRVAFFSKNLFFDDADPKKASGIGRVEDPCACFGPIDHVCAGFQKDLMVAAAIIGDHYDLSRSGFGITHSLDGEGCESCVRGGKVGKANGGWACNDREIGLRRIIAIKSDQGAIDGDIDEGFIAHIVGGGGVTFFKGDCY